MYKPRRKPREALMNVIAYLLGPLRDHGALYQLTISSIWLEGKIKKFVIWPKRCMISKRIIFLEYAYQIPIVVQYDYKSGGIYKPWAKSIELSMLILKK